MPTPPSLTDDELERLDELLETTAVPHDGMSLEMLDGFFSSLVVGPELISLDEYWPQIWNHEVVWRQPSEADQALQLIGALWNDVVARLQVELPDADDRSEQAALQIEAAMPLLAFPESDPADETDPLGGIDPEFPLAAAWALGFLRGMDLRSDAWADWEDAEPDIAEAIGDIARLTVLDAEQATEMGLDEDDVPDINERMQTAGSIPLILRLINDHRLAQLPAPAPRRVEAGPGRNDPCPCGSGKKFKKCCGDPAKLN